MTRKRVFLILALLVIGGISVSVFLQSKYKPTSDALLQAEQEVFVILLKDLSFIEGDEYPILEHTTLGRVQEIAELEFNMFINSDTVSNFQENNKQNYSVKDYLPPTIDISLNPVESQETYWWISFSRAGFNSSLTQALISYEDHLECTNEGCPYGTGNLIFLQKVFGKWIIQDRYIYWRSHPS